MTRKSVLTIAGSDPSGGAGLQADLAVFAALGRHGMAVPTGLTIQNSLGVHGATHVDAELLVRQLASLFADCPPAAAKTGMLPTAQIVHAVVEIFAARPRLPLVVDPVASSAGGVRLVDAAAETALACVLLPLAAVVTPNAVEAARMTGLDVASTDDAVAAARRLVALGARAVVVKGGHLCGDTATDVLLESDGRPVLLSRPRITPPRRVHGTGCAFSAALAAHLADGLSIVDATRAAGDYVHAAIASAFPIGSGASVLDFSARPAGAAR